MAGDTAPEHNPKLTQVSERVVQTMRNNSQTPLSYRPGHARGRLVRGHFTPSPAAALLSSAPHFKSPVTPVLLRFSSGTGDPNIADTNPAAQPRGLAIRFELSDDQHTDIIAHSVPHFPMPTAEGLLAFQLARGDGTMADFLSKNPTAKRFVEAPKPPPKSFGSERYFALTAYRLVNNKTGSSSFVRYQFEPVKGSSYLSEDEIKAASGSYLYEDLVERLTYNNFKFKFLAQIAREEDCTDDITKPWPSSRNIVELGEITAETVLDEQISSAMQKDIVFDPMPRVEGIEPSADPLLRPRSAAYHYSAQIRRRARNDPKLSPRI